MPVLDKPSFLHQYKFLMDNVRDPALARSQAPFMALVFAVFACAARLVDDPRLSTGPSLDDGGMGMIYYERQEYLADRYPHDPSDPPSLSEAWYYNISVIRIPKSPTFNVSF